MTGALSGRPICCPGGSPRRDRGGWHNMQQAKRHDVRLQAEFIPSGRNRLMNVMLRLAGFQEVDRCCDRVILECALEEVGLFPGYVQVRIVDGAA